MSHETFADSVNVCGSSILDPCPIRGVRFIGARREGTDGGSVQIRHRDGIDAQRAYRCAAIFGVPFIRYYLHRVRNCAMPGSEALSSNSKPGDVAVRFAGVLRIEIQNSRIMLSKNIAKSLADVSISMKLLSSLHRVAGRTGFQTLV